MRRERGERGLRFYLSRLAFPGEASSNSKPSDTRPLVDHLDKWPRLILVATAIITQKPDEEDACQPR